MISQALIVLPRFPAPSASLGRLSRSSFRVGVRVARLELSYAAANAKSNRLVDAVFPTPIRPAPRPPASTTEPAAPGAATNRRWRSISN